MLQLAEVRNTAAEAKLQVRRELTRKMRLKLEETEAMWGKKHDALLAQLESLTASTEGVARTHEIVHLRHESAVKHSDEEGDTGNHLKDFEDAEARRPHLQRSGKPKGRNAVIYFYCRRKELVRSLQKPRQFFA